MGESVSIGAVPRVMTPNSTPIILSKKQKRNHREQQTLNERKPTKVDTSQQNSTHGDIGVNRMAFSVPTSVEEQVIAAGVLRTLEQATTGAIEKYFLIRNHCNGFHGKDFHLKTSYRLLPPSKRERKRSQIKAVSSICAQICGQLGTFFSDDPISREQLVCHVVQAMKNSVESSPDTAIISPNDHTISITAIDAHQPSGQIICTIRVNKEKTEGNTDMVIDDENDNTTEMKGSPSKEHDNLCRVGSNGDSSKLAQWYEKITGKRLEFEPNKQRITIETLPSHQSALNPDVHKLYAHYQHVVHGDPNPFSNDKIAKTGNGDNCKSDEDDEEPKIETDDPSALDWGDSPTYFTSEITAMLTSYIQHLESKERRRAVLSNYYSFYQFLVEAPFPLDRGHHKQNGSQGNHGRDTQDPSGLLQDTKPDIASSNLPCGLYHQQYRIGGDFLIAVGVIDVLPTGLSSVYLFYHPSFSYELVALGKYAILKEIEFARDVLNVPYYYLGYYIESCQKMRYKADYKPTQILCPKYYNWVDASVAISKLQMTPRHVCPLTEPNLTIDNEEKQSHGIENGKSGMMANNGMTAQDDVAKALNLLQMDVGVGMNVTIDMLHPNGVEVVKPILKEFVLEFSPRLSNKCVLKLN